MDVHLYELWDTARTSSACAVSSPSTAAFKDLTVLLRKVRNALGRAAAGGEHEMVAALPDYVAVMSDLVAMMRSLCIRNILDNDDDDQFATPPSSSLSDEEEFAALSLVVFQCIANYLQTYELSNRIWRKLYHSNAIADMVMVSVKCRRRKNLSVILNILYNCIRLEEAKTSETCEEEEKEGIQAHKVDDLMTNRSLMCQLLLAVIDCNENGSQNRFSPGHLSSDIVSSLPSEGTSELDPVMNWMYLFLEILIKHGKLSQLFILVGPVANVHGAPFADVCFKYVNSVIAELQHSECKINCEQLILMNCIFDIVDDENENYINDLRQELLTISIKDIRDFGTSNPTVKGDTHYSKKSSRDLWIFVHVLMMRLLSAIEQTRVGENENASDNLWDNENSGHGDIFGEQLKNSSLLFLLRLLCSVMIRFFSEGKTILGKAIRESLILSFPIAVREIVSLLPQDAAIIRSNSGNNCKNGTIATTHHIDVDNDITKSTLRLLATIIYDCKELQNELRICGGLATVLSHCGTDFSNPLSREWALFCVKNACEDNEENVNFINSLKPTKVFQHAALEARGIQVELSSEGKLRFNDMKNTSNDDSSGGGN